MATPDVEDVSPSPEYSPDLDDDMAAEQKSGHSPDGSPEQKPTNGSKSNAKDPTRPRRKKARRACFSCQRAHLTCGDERPCNRCIKRGLGDTCMDGVRKKAKYLHDAPEGALMPGVGGHYPFMNGNRPTPLPSQDAQAVTLSPQQNTIYSQAPSGTFYPPPSAPVQLSQSQDGRTFNNQQSPISPPYSQAHHGSISSVSNAPSTMSQGQPTPMPQFGPLFDPSDPALFNFDISSLNFGNHYGALEFGMLGHMSSGAGDDNSMMSHMNPTTNMYGTQVPGYPDQSGGVPYGSNGMSATDWQDAQARQSSMNVHSNNNTPVMGSMDQNGNRHESINGPHAFAIGQGPASHTTASPASTDASAFENDHPLSSATFFANASANQPHPQRSPTVSRQQHDGRPPSTALQPIHANGIRKKQRDSKSIYDGITKPHDYVKGFHRMFTLCYKKFDKGDALSQAQEYLKLYRPVLLRIREELNQEDLLHQEKSLQRNLDTLQKHFAEVGTPFLLCRRSGEIVGINKEFTILTGWRKEVLLGQEPNLNVNLGPQGQSSFSTQTNTTPVINAQDNEAGVTPVNILELLDAKSALEYLHHFSELCWQDPHGHAKQRANLLRYQTQTDLDRIQEMKSRPDQKSDPLVKIEGGAVHQGESAMQKLGARNGMVDCMAWWHMKRDIFEMPYLVCMSVMPVLDKGLQ